MRLLRPLEAASVAVALAAASSGCGLVYTQAQSRITQAPDTEVRQSSTPPDSGLLAGGGIFQLANATVSDGVCDQHPPQDGTEMFQNPLQPKPDTGTKVPLVAEQQQALAAFLGAVEIRSAALGQAAAVQTGPDSSASLPWTGRVTGGKVHRLQVRSIVASLADRDVSLEIDVPQEAAVVAQGAVTATYSVDWKESGTSPAWVGASGDGTADCTASGTVTASRVAQAAPDATAPPTGSSTVLHADPAPAGPTRQVLDAVNASHWFEGDGGAIALQRGDQGIASGNVLQSGGTYVLDLSGQAGDVVFSLRGSKAEDGRVRGTLLAGGVGTYVELAG